MECVGGLVQEQLSYCFNSCLRTFYGGYRHFLYVKEAVGRVYALPLRLTGSATRIARRRLT